MPILRKAYSPRRRGVTENGKKDQYRRRRPLGESDSPCLRGEMMLDEFPHPVLNDVLPSDLAAIGFAAQQ